MEYIWEKKEKKKKEGKKKEEESLEIAENNLFMFLKVFFSLLDTAILADRNFFFLQKQRPCKWTCHQDIREWS